MKGFIIGLFMGAAVMVPAAANSDYYLNEIVNELKKVRSSIDDVNNSVQYVDYLLRNIYEEMYRG